MKRVVWFWIFLGVHLIYWVFFLRHLPFFRQSLFFTDLDAYLWLWRDVFAGISPYHTTHMMPLGPPIIMVPYLPFALINHDLAQFAFFVINVVSGYWLCSRLSRYLKLSDLGFMVMSLVLFVTFPVRFSLLMGQPALITAALITYFLTSKASALNISGLILFKTYFIFILIKFWKTILKYIIQFSLLIFAFSPLLKITWYQNYFQTIFRSTLVVASKGMSTDYYNQSLKSTLERLAMERLYLPIWIFAAIILSWLCLRLKSDNLLIMSSIFLSPIIWQHYFVYLFPIFMLMFWQSKQNVVKLCLIVFWVLCSVQISSLHESSLNLFTGILASHMFIGLVGMMLIEIRHPRTLLVESLF